MFYGLHLIHILYYIENSNLTLINLYLIIYLPAKFLFTGGTQYEVNIQIIIYRHAVLIDQI